MFCCRVEEKDILPPLEVHISNHSKHSHSSPSPKQQSLKSVPFTPTDPNRTFSPRHLQLHVDIDPHANDSSPSFQSNNESYITRTTEHLLHIPSENDVDIDKISSSSDNESNISFDDGEANDANQVITNWLEEEDEEQEDIEQEIKDNLPPPIVIPEDPYMKANKRLYLALAEVEDLNFIKLPQTKQLELMQSLIIEIYHPNDVIFEQDTYGQDVYFIIGATEEIGIGEVEVVKVEKDNTEKVLTRLCKGQYFGQKFFLTNRTRQRSATIRIPSDNPCNVEIAKLVPESFQLWDSFRTMLLIKAAPLIQMLPKEELNEVIDKMQIKEYKPNEYIIRQGEKGDEFFIIREGAVKIVDEITQRTLTTLKEGHFFGEMALITDEPRVASVIALDGTICLALTKAAFKSALSATTFSEVLNQALEKRKEVREQRQQQESLKSLKSPSESFSIKSPVGGGSGGSGGLGGSGGGAVTPNGGGNNTPGSKKISRQNSTVSSLSLSSTSTPSDEHLSLTSAFSVKTEVTETSILKYKRLSSGTKLINKYSIIKELGRGAFGEVFLCQDIETNVQYAMKVINRAASSSSGNDESIKREIAVMKRLRHRNIVSLHEVIDDPSSKKIFLIQELMEGGPLMPDHEKTQSLTEDKCRKYFRDIISGVSYLHALGIIHRDIKPSNMLLTADGRVKIADFGAAVFSSAYERAVAGGTPAFMAPELCTPNSNLEVNKLPAIDVFALGATLYCMVVGRPPWMADNAIDLAAKIRNIELTFPYPIDDTIDPHLKHLLKRMLDKDYKTRMTMEEVIEDDWVTLEGSEPLFNDINHDNDDDDFFNLDTLNSRHSVSRKSAQLNAHVLRELIRTASFDDSHMQFHALIADHRPVTRINMSDQLREMDIKSKPVDSVDMALHEVQNCTSRNIKGYDFVLLDMCNSTIEMLPKFREAGFTGCLIAIADSVGEGHEIRNSGFADYILIKPFESERLKKIVTMTIEGLSSSSDNSRTGRRPSETSTLTSFDVNSTTAAMDNNMFDLEVNDAIYIMPMGSNSTHTSLSSPIPPLRLAEGGVVEYTQRLKRSRDGMNSSHVSLLLPPETNSPGSPVRFSSKHLNTVKSEANLFEDYPKPFIGSPKKPASHNSSMTSLLDDESKSVSSSTSNNESRRLTRTKDFMLIPSDIVFNESGRRAQKAVLSVGKTNNGYRKKMRENAMNESKRLAAGTTAPPAPPGIQHFLTNLTPSSRTKAYQPGFFRENEDGEEGDEDDDSPNSNAHHSFGSRSVFFQSRVSLLKSRLQTVEESPSIDSSDDVHESESMNSTNMSLSTDCNQTFLVKHDEHNIFGDNEDHIIREEDEDENCDDDSDDDDDNKASETSSICLQGDDIIYSDIAGLDALLDLPSRTVSLTDWHKIDRTLFSRDDILATTSKDKYANPSLKLRLGSYSEIGGREYMEDRCVIESQLIKTPCQNGINNLSFFAVYDGHNGEEVVDHLTLKFHQELFSMLNNGLVMKLPSSHDTVVAHCLKSICRDLDMEVLQRDYRRQLENQRQQRSALLLNQKYSGSCAVIMTVYRTAAGKNCLTIANVGDCRAVLCVGDGVAKQLTTDHKPSLPEEKHRIEESGGFVNKNRVSGILAVSRSFGDLPYKLMEVTSDSNTLQLQRQVISDPQIIELELSGDEHFAILACDGLWDVLDSQQAVNFVKYQLTLHHDLDLAAKNLVQCAIENGSDDNITVVLCIFQ